MRTKMDIIDQNDGTCYCDTVIHDKDDEYMCFHDYVSYSVSLLLEKKLKWYSKGYLR